MKAEFFVGKELVEVRRNLNSCPRKGEIVTFDGQKFFEVREVVNDFCIGRFVLQIEERQDFEPFREETETQKTEATGDPKDADDSRYEYDDDLDDDYEGE